jgi:ADP-heptose:LPS heptosyltransferase
MRLLVIRTSAMGDVALVSPVLSEMKKQYPETEITLLTRQPFKSFFNQSEKHEIFSPDFSKRHKGLWGLYRLYRDIQEQANIDYVIDLHDVIRSKILRYFFRYNGVPVSVIDKGRREKKELISGKRKVQLKHTVTRYCDTFAAAGFPLTPSGNQIDSPSLSSLIRAGEIFKKKSGLNAGVAPYAKHKLKLWPEEYMVTLLNMISERADVNFFLFGGREESQQLDEFTKKVKGCSNLAGTLSLEEELAVMSKLDFMIAMDSSNMHMAVLAGTKVISIWGGTDPLSGFGAWMQPIENSVRISVDELTCRPCTIYGKGECKRGDLACMNWLKPGIVLDRIIESKLI